MSEINMPKLSDTMEEGTIVEWKKKSGDVVKNGDVLAEAESDKATFDLEADADGVLTVIVEQGVPAKIGAAIARIGEAGEVAPAPKPKETPKEKPAAKAEKPAPREAPPEENSDGQHAVATASSTEVKASPLAKRLAAEMGVDLGSLKGSGPEGRIVKEDVLAAAGGEGPATGVAPRSPRSRPTGPPVEIEEPTRMQATIARRMAESKTTVPHF